MDAEQLVLWIRDQTGWLYHQVYQNQLFFFDLWSLAHLWSGFVLFSILLAIKVKYPWLWLFVSLVAYEVAELAMLYLSLHVFFPETIKDQFTDIFIGILGGAIGYFYAGKLFRRSTLSILILDFECLFIGMTVAFLWVGHTRFILMQEAVWEPFSIGLFFWRWLLVYLLVRFYACLKWEYAEIKIRMVLLLVAFLLLFAFYRILLNFNPLLSGSYSGTFSLSRESGDLNLAYQFGFLLGVVLLYEMVSNLLSKATSEFLQKYPNRQAIQTTITEVAQEY